MILFLCLAQEAQGVEHLAVRNYQWILLEKVALGVEPFEPALVPGVTSWNRLYREGWSGSKRSCTQMQVCWFLFVCLYVSSLGRLAWSYIFPVNMKFHDKFCSISLRCEHRGRNVWTFSWPSTSFFLLVWALLAAHWHVAENFFSFPKVFASIATNYLLVTVHRTEDVIKQEANKNSKAAPWERQSKSCSNRGRATSTVHFGSWYEREIHNLWFPVTGSPFRYFIRWSQ